MRTLLLAAVAGLVSAGAQAADIRMPMKAPPPPVASWTGCYLGAGGGYGLLNEEQALVTVAAQGGVPAGTRFVDGLTQGGRGWFGTAQVGCDYQFVGPIG